MAELVQKLVTEDSFDARGVYVPAGHIGAFDPAFLTGEEPHIAEVGDFQPAIVEQSAIGPSGPNPRIPQQIPGDAEQAAGGVYVRPGVLLVAEHTDLVEPYPEGDPDAEADVNELLRKAYEETARLRAENEGLRQGRETEHRSEIGRIRTGGKSPSLKDVMGEDDDGAGGNYGTKSDDELGKLAKDEEKRDRPRRSVLSAIKAEQDSRKAKRS